MPFMMRKMPMIMPTSPGKMISRMPKIMQITAKTGLETVMPTFRKPFSTVSVKKYVPPDRNFFVYCILRLVRRACYLVDLEDYDKIKRGALIHMLSQLVSVCYE